MTLHEFFTDGCFVGCLVGFRVGLWVGFRVLGLWVGFRVGLWVGFLSVDKVVLSVSDDEMSVDAVVTVDDEDSRPACDVVVWSRRIPLVEA